MRDEKRELKKRSLRIVKKLKELFPHAKIVLKYRNNWELLVSVILSAQCTDKKVNEVTKKLFSKYKTLNDYIKVSQAEFEQDIKPTGFYRAKTKNILGAAKMLKEKFGGKVPKTMQEILKLPGVARKTANVVLGNAYGIVEGIAVDTHVMRLTQKLGLTKQKDPVKIEKDLMNLVPKKDWFFLTYGLIEYGRHICVKRKHECKDHSLTKIYPRAAAIWP
ncbi:endonuclease III [Patescibacteria group bacterium]|nr:endonuclease III [Patescibacteria group bacterium]